MPQKLRIHIGNSFIMSVYFQVQLTQLQSGVLRDFDFLVQSLWVEVVEKFDKNLMFVFSAGDPDKFHSNFTTMYAWLDDFEKRLGNIKAIENFRQNPSYAIFIGRWNVSIYFQIRQQVCSTCAEFNSYVCTPVIKESSLSFQFYPYVSPRVTVMLTGLPKVEKLRLKQLKFIFM